jgi:lysophospholipase L1-like esterase
LGSHGVSRERGGASGHGDPRLRIALAGLLGVLVAAGLLAHSIPRPVTTVVSAGLPGPPSTSASGPSRPAPHGTLPSGSRPGPSVPPSTVAPSPPGQRPVAGHGCGFGLAPRPVPAPVGRCTVLEIGDSLGSDLGWGIARHVGPASGLDLVQADKASTGLADPSFWNWPAELATDLGEYHPQLVIVCLGGNDEQGLYAGGTPVQFPTPAWKAAYLGRVRQIVHEATAAGAYVLWVGMPVMQQPGFSEGMQILDSLFAEGVASDPNAEFLSVWRLFADPAGQYANSAEVEGSTVSLRQPDGVHYSFAGEDVIATYVLSHLAAMFHVRLAPVHPAVITASS